MPSRQSTRPGTPRWQPANWRTPSISPAAAAEAKRQTEVRLARENPQSVNDTYRGHIQASAMFPNARDPFAGVNQFDIMAQLAGMRDTDPTPSGGSRGRGGGGGGGSSGPTAEELAAEAALAEQRKQAFNAALAGISDNGGLYDDYEARLRRAQGEAGTRNAGIISDLNTNQTGVQARTNAAYGSADQAIAALAAQYAQRGADVDRGASGLAEAFGGQAESSGGSVADLANAARVLNTQRQGFANTADAQRGGVYNALGADLSTATGQGFDGLLAQIQAKRLADQQAAAKERASLMLQAANAGVTL